MKRAGDLLTDFFNEHFDPVSLQNGRLTARLFSSWTAAVKAANIPVAADHARIRELEHKVLVIEAEHPGWVQLLQTKQSQLLQYMQIRFPELEIQGISFCLSHDSISLPPVSTAKKPSVFEIEPQFLSESAIEPCEKNETLYESMKRFKKVIQKRNKNY